MTMADYIVFIVEERILKYYGYLKNMKDIVEAKSKLKHEVRTKGNVFYLMNTKNLVKVKA